VEELKRLLDQVPAYKRQRIINKLLIAAEKELEAMELDRCLLIAEQVARSRQQLKVVKEVKRGNQRKRSK
jgi:hypothetical protein